MKLLLDTHALLWAQVVPARLSLAAGKALENERNEILVSVASAWEVATKVRIGKLPGFEEFERDFISALDDAGYLILPIDVETALRAGRLIGAHKDPFDRMLAAQALAEDIPIISSDPMLDTFGVRRIW